MNKSLLTTILAACTALTMQAQELGYLTFLTTGGNELSFPANGLKITFGNGTMPAVSGALSKTFQLADLSTLRFTDTPTAINGIETASRQDAHIENGWLKTSAGLAGQRARIYRTDGRQAYDGTLTGGIYIVKINGKTYKVLAQ